MRRLRLRFDGFVGDPRFLYAIQLSFAPGDVGETTEGENLNVIRDAVFYYRANPRLSLGFGQTKLPGNRQRVNSSGALQLTDRSINNAVYTIDRDFGFLFDYNRQERNRFSYNVKGAVSNGDGRNSYKNSLAAATGRIELMPLGAFINNGTMFEGDLMREPSPRIMIGATAHVNGANRSRGQLGSRLPESRSIQSYHVDAMLKYRGFAMMGAWMGRFADDPVVRSDFDGSMAGYYFTGTGWDMQASYLLPTNVEFIGRLSRQMPDSAIRDFEPERKQYSVGITRYVWEHALKVQGEFTYERRNYAGLGNRDLSYIRFQVEIGI